MDPHCTSRTERRQKNVCVLDRALSGSQRRTSCGQTASHSFCQRGLFGCGCFTIMLASNSGNIVKEGQQRKPGSEISISVDCNATIIPSLWKLHAKKIVPSQITLRIVIWPHNRVGLVKHVEQCVVAHGATSWNKKARRWLNFVV